MSGLHVFATIRPKPAHFDEALAAIKGIVPQTLEEPGCRTFTLLRGETGETLHLVEEWVDETALAAHYDKPYTREVFAAYQGWLAAAPEVVKMRPAG